MSIQVLDQDILQTLRGLSNGEPNCVANILFGFQNYPDVNSEDHLRVLAIEQELISSKLVEVTENGGTNKTPNGYYFFVITPQGRSRLSISKREINALSKDKYDQQLLKIGMTNRGLLGYLNPIQATETFGLEQYLITFSKGNDYFYTMDVSREKFRGRDPINQGILGYARKAPGLGYQQLHRFFSDKHQVHLFTTTPDLVKSNTEYNRNESIENPIYIKETGSNYDVPLYLYSNSSRSYLGVITPPKQDNDQASAENYQRPIAQWKEEIGNILLWDLYQVPEPNYYGDVKQQLELYNIDINERTTLEIVDMLREKRYVHVDKDNAFRIVITATGKEYVKNDIKPLQEKSRDFTESTIQTILRTHLNQDDFRVDFSKEFVKVNYFPNGRGSDYEFLAQKISSLFYRIKSTPRVDPPTRLDIKAILKALDLWASEVKKKHTSSHKIEKNDQGSTEIQNGCFVVDSIWNDGDHAHRFFSEQSWKTNSESNKSEIDSISEGDSLVLKSIVSRSGKNYLRVKGLGKVIQKTNDKGISVDWWYKGPPFDIELSKVYRLNIQRLAKEDWGRIQAQLELEAKRNDNVSLQHDGLSDVDLLGREPFIQALSDYIRTLSTTQGDNPYMIHLDGEWGSGKSNTLKFLGRKLSGTNEWLIVNYNAWENQHVEPPWWNFMDNVYRSILNQTDTRLRRWWIRLREFYWRFFSINRTNVAITFFLLACLFGFLWKWAYVAEALKSDTDNRIGDVIDIVVGMTSLFGAIWLLIQWVKNSLLVNSSESIINFKKSADDPIRRIKEHFTAVTNYTPKKVAIFIDDIDRCNSSAVIKLLEGIQTLFKFNRIIYVVTGDGIWIKQCFESHYSEFCSVVTKPGSSLGNLFQEKLFQMSIGLPRLTPATMDSFLKSLLTDPNSTTTKRESQEKVGEFRMEFAQAIGSKEQGIQKILDQYKETEEEFLVVRAAVEEMSNKITLIELEHKLQPYSSYLPANARAVKRFINNYALKRQSLIIQGVSFNDVDFDSLVRWQILSSKYPRIADVISENPGLITTTDHSIFQDLEFVALMGSLSERTVRLLLGK